MKPAGPIIPLRQALLVAGLVAAHEVLRRSLAEDAIASALFSRSGPHAAATVGMGLVFLVIRLALLVVVPGWIGAKVADFLSVRS